MDDFTRRARLGEGRISGVASLALGCLSVAAILCLRFPAWLVTAELARNYDVGLLRLLLALVMALAGFLALVTFALNRYKRLGALGLSALALGLLLGGPYVPAATGAPGAASLGLDWFVLDLFFTGSIFIALEWIFPRVVPEQAVLRPGWRLDLGYFAVNHLLIGVFLLVSTHFAHDLFGWAVNTRLQAGIAALPAVLRLLLVILAADAVEYTTHRAYHEWPWLWRFHAIHHSPTHMDWLSGSRLHIGEVLLTRSTVLVPIFLLGFPQDTIFTYILFVSVQAVLIHSNIKLSLGWLGTLIVTPQFHHWHHSSEAEALDRNYGAHTPLFDLLFGTYYQPAGAWPQRYGTVKPIPGRFLAQMVYPFTHSAESLEPEP